MRALRVTVLVLATACGGGGGGGDGDTAATQGASATEATTAGASASASAATSAGSGVDTASDGASDDPGADDSTGSTPTECDGDCTYVRAGASGSGADWADALAELPETLERGRVYFVAAGSYAGATIDDPAAGTATIRVLRATADDHGTDDGWEPAFGEGLAELGPIVLAAPFVELDGRGALRIVGTFESTVVEIQASDVTLRGCDLDGNFTMSKGQQTDGACTGLNVAGDGVVVANNLIHGIADDGVSITGSSGVSFRGNTVHALHGCGTDGGCGPCYNGHSDGLEIYDLVDSEIVGNVIYDVASTAALFFGNWADELGGGPDEYCENILLANNIFYSPQTGFVAYLEDVRGVQVYSNVMWGFRDGAYGGLAIGTNVTGLDLYDNAIVSINYDHLGSTHDAAEHRGDYNLFAASLGQWQDGPHDVVAIDAGFTGIPDADGAAVADPTPQDFVPIAGSPLVDAGWAGDADIAIPDEDFFGEPRGDPPNIGAIE
ncbi:MAG TPA: right-handed parallel beta-helix repeat-containing protein [Nannocystaceae bacterium]|nr:right-handed parallel beta-helix repeat-containing protein [Nannocystaceae bacterium]